jgi:hypothetical protein
MKMIDAALLVGTVAMWRAEDVTVPVTLDDVKAGFGSFRFLVSPVGGTGQQWVDEARLSFAMQDA